MLWLVAASHGWVQCAEEKVTKSFKGTKVSPDANFSLEGTEGGTFALASGKKGLKQLMTVMPARVVETSKTKSP